VLRVLPAVRRLRVEMPELTIGWAVEQWALPVLAGNPNVDRFHVLDRKELRAGATPAWREIVRLRREIRAGNYDLVLDFHGRFKSGVTSLASGAARRVGFARGDSSEGNHLFNNVHVHLKDRWENRVLRFLHLLRPLGIEAAFDIDETGLNVPPVEREKARLWYETSGCPAVAAYPGTSQLRAYARWPREKWLDLLRRLGREGVSSVVFWGPADAEFARSVAEGAGECALLAPPTTLPEMMAMLGRFRAFIGSNSAAMHMAWLQRVPTAVFLGPVRPRTDAPLPPVPSRILWREDLYREGRRRKYQSEVVGEVPVETALQAVRELLGSESL